MNLKINVQFKELIPELENHQYDVLKDDIKENGIRDPLLVWNNVIILMDIIDTRLLRNLV